jgi:protein ImuB
VRTLGELAALPARGLHDRLGPEGPRLRRLASGEDQRPLLPWEPPPLFEESVECDWGIETLEPIARLLTELAERLCQQLARRGLGADRFEWRCRLADRSVHEGEWVPAVPMNEPALVVPLLQTSFAARPPRVAVEGITLRARPTRLHPLQGNFTDPLRSSPRLLQATLARLAELAGPARLGVPVLLDSHRPGAVALAPFTLAGEREEGPGERVEDTERAPALALRRFRPPRPAKVRLTAGRPVHLRSGWLAGAIVAGVGPWRASGEWWTVERWVHDEWDVELRNGTLCRLAHDGSAWFLDGVYD